MTAEAAHMPRFSEAEALAFEAERRAVRQADFSQVELIGAWLAADPFGEVQRRYRRGCRCVHRQYCGPGCGAHTE